MSNRPGRKGPKPEHTGPKEPSVSLHFNSSEQYADWQQERAFRQAAMVIQGLIEAADADKINGLQDMLVASLDVADSQKALRIFFNVNGGQ